MLWQLIAVEEISSVGISVLKFDAEFLSVLCDQIGKKQLNQHLATLL